MIINIRGTHGSGKSTIVRSLLDRYEHAPYGWDERGKTKKPLGYLLKLGRHQLLYVIGPYENACGGCDAIQPYKEIWPRVEWCADRGHVIFEGALVSSSYGNIGRDSERFGNQFVFAFLNTPLQVCLDRIKARREARGDTRPLNPQSTTQKYNGIQRSIPKIRDEFKRNVVILQYQRALPQVLGLLHGTIQD